MTVAATVRTPAADPFGPTPVYTAGAAPRHRRGARRRGQDALLLLRPAVRHPAQGQGQRRHRLRAVVRVSLQPGQALPQGRQALPAGRAPRPPAARLRTRRGGAGGLPADGIRGGHRSRGRGDRSHPDRARAQCLCHAQRGQPHHRKGLPDRQVRPHDAAHLQHRLQRPPVHGQRRRGQQEGVWHRSRRQPLGRHPRRTGDLDQRRQHRRVPPDHHRLRLAGARDTAPRSSSSTRASRRLPAPATSSCRSSRGATWRSSTASCT